MTRLKAILKQYTKNLVVLSETDDSVTIDSNTPLGYTTLTCNDWGDIIDITTNYHRIKAVSNLPHGRDIIDDQMLPTEWSDVYYADMGTRVCIREDGTHYIIKSEEEHICKFKEHIQ